jgi:phosphopantothenoylcysteine decarboxylase/phosphopantothenate--cysteine ligase
LTNKTVLVTAGPTYEPIDPVRFIGNRSSGKQGIAIAKVFAENGYKVFLVVGPVNGGLLKNLDEKITVEKVNTAEEMLVASLKYIAECDVAIHSAAVSDYRPKEAQKTKIKIILTILCRHIPFRAYKIKPQSLFRGKNIFQKIFSCFI